jgi:tRNA(fMet)-specific endonuclease VapC
MPAYMLDAGRSAAILKRTDTTLKWLHAVAGGDVCVSAVTLSELMLGVAMSQRETQDQAMLDLFLKYVAAPEYPCGAAAHYGEIRMALELRGEMIGANDLLIAAHAR